MAIYVAKERSGGLPRGSGPVRLCRERAVHELDRLRAGPPRKGVIPVRLGLVAEIKFFGRHKGGWIRDGVILSLNR